MKLDATDRALLALVLSVLAMSAMAAPRVIADCSLGRFTDEPADLPGFFIVILRDGTQHRYRRIDGGDFQTFINGEPRVQDTDLCLLPRPDIDRQGDRYE